MSTTYSKYILIFQGSYYLITGLWSLVSIESFSAFTQYQGDYFLKHTSGLLFSVLGALFIVFALKEQRVRTLALLALATALGVMAVEWYYVPRIGNPFPFWIDFWLEGLFAVLLLISLMIKTPISLKAY